ncbi:MAG: HD domain-containing protein [Desulfobacterales bacterium]|nr:HD domain-containing protein [Desulfobacterales bacterium]
MQSKKIKGKNFSHLYFPLAKLSKSIFTDLENGIFADKYKTVMTSILGKQLAVNTYYANDLIAMANTRITIDILKQFDQLKINFKVNTKDITEDERNMAMDLAMGEIITTKKTFLESIKSEDIPQIQTSVKQFINNAITKQNQTFFNEYFEELKEYVEMANSIITTEDNYIGTVVAIKKIIDNEQRVFKLPKDHIGETIEHVIKTTQISLMIARELDDFNQENYKTLSIIGLGHDSGKALIPEEIIYKKGRLTQLENDIMKSHALLSFILASNNQNYLGFEPFVMALHHIKEDKNLPQSYGISKDTHTSFYEYLTPNAQNKLNEMFHLTKKYYRVISIADTFEALTAPRVYKKPSSIGKALDIMLNDNKKSCFFYPPYLEKFIELIIKKYLPKNMVFKLSDEIIKKYYFSNDLVFENIKQYKKDYMGVIIQTPSNFNQDLVCVVYNLFDQKIERKLHISPIFFLDNIYF